MSPSESPRPRQVTGRCVARAALAGNPSDGYGGVVVAVPVRSLAAEVHIVPIRRGWVVEQSGQPTATFDDAPSMTQAIRDAAPELPHALVLATLGAWVEHHGPVPASSFSVRSSIPRSVGLAGSSAIVIATLRALAAATGRTLPAADELAALALAVETERLGITAGLQDRVVQSHDRAMSMRFDTRPFCHDPVAHPVLHWFVASRAERAEPSQAVHGDLRRRFDAGEPGLATAMRELADAGLAATAALARGDVRALGAEMDRTFAVRQRILPLDPSHVEMVDAARSAGAHANFAGSGGAVVVLAADARGATAARTALAALGCAVAEIGSS